MERDTGRKSDELKESLRKQGSRWPEKQSGTQRTEHSWGEGWRAGARLGEEAESPPGKMEAAKPRGGGWAGRAGTNDGDAPKRPFSQPGDGPSHGDMPPGVVPPLATPLSPGRK